MRRDKDRGSVMDRNVGTVLNLFDLEGERNENRGFFDIKVYFSTKDTCKRTCRVKRMLLNATSLERIY